MYSRETVFISVVERTRQSVSGRWTQATVQPSSRVTMMQSRVSVLTGTSTELYLVVWIGQSRYVKHLLNIFEIV